MLELPTLIRPALWFKTHITLRTATRTASQPAMEDDGFTSVTYKKDNHRPVRNRKGKNRYRERTLDEKLQAREAELRRSGYLQECRSAWSIAGL